MRANTDGTVTERCMTMEVKRGNEKERKDGRKRESHTTFVHISRPNGNLKNELYFFTKIPCVLKCDAETGLGGEASGVISVAAYSCVRLCVFITRR